MSRLSFSAPNQAPAHLSLRQAAAAAGFDEADLRLLLFLVNAHPKLIGHAQVFKHIAVHFETPRFHPDSLTWAGEWKESVPAWQEISRWIWTDRNLLAQLSGLERLDEQQAHRGDHPHLNEGVVRHGLPAALWNFHETTPGYPPAPENKAGTLYFELQGHVLAAAVDARFRVSTQSFYESYSLEVERPIAPIRFSTVSPAIRELSLNQYSYLVVNFPSCASTEVYATRFLDLEFPVIGGDADLVAERPLGRIKSYFSAFLRVLKGWKPNQSLRPGWGGGSGGGHSRRPGFVPWSDSGNQHVLIRKDHPSPDDELPSLPIQFVAVERGGTEEDAANEIESSGLSPGETVEVAVGLFNPADLGDKIGVNTFQRRALEMRAQFLPFSYSMLTPTEIQRVWQIADEAIVTHLSESLHQESMTALAGLAIKLQLLYGQSVADLVELELAWTSNPDANDWISGERRERALIFSGDAPGDWNTARYLGLNIPAIMPAYQTRLPDALESADRDYASGFVLPEVAGVGGQLIRFFKHHPGTRLFMPKRDAGALEQAIKQLLKKANDTRITPLKVSRVLSDAVTAFSGDQSLAWLLTADESSADEPRMHYTRQPIKRLKWAFERASKRLCRNIGHPYLTVKGEGTFPDPDKSVGARFVLSTDTLRDIIGLLVKLLENRRLQRQIPGVAVEYHNTYVLYIAIYQSLATSMRAVSDPNLLFQESQRVTQGSGTLLTSLADKDNQYVEKARLVTLDPDLRAQFSFLAEHYDYLRTHVPGCFIPLSASEQRSHPLLTISASYDIDDMTPGWITQKLEELTGYPIPANFHRAYLRTELLARQCPVQSIDALLGHANDGESPFSRYSTFDYTLHLKTIIPLLREIRQGLGLHPIPSRLIPFPQRTAGKSGIRLA